MVILSARVFGDPKGQPRPRAFARGGKARVYDPCTAEGWKSQVAAAIVPPANRIAGPVTVALNFYFARAKGHFRKNGTLTPNAPLAHTGKPDADNLAKAVLDALTTLGVWVDDGQVTLLVVGKRYVEGAERPGCDITISTNIHRDEPGGTRCAETPTPTSTAGSTA